MMLAVRCRLPRLGFYASFQLASGGELGFDCRSLLIYSPSNLNYDAAPAVAWLLTIKRAASELIISNYIKEILLSFSCCTISV